MRADVPIIRIRDPLVVLGLLGVILSAGCSAGKTATGGSDQVTIGSTGQASSCLGAVARSWILGRPRPARPRELSTPLETSILSRFAIFHKAALGSDESPIRAGDLGRALAKGYELSSYYPGYLRQLGTLADGRRYFAIPAFGRFEGLPPVNCRPAALRRELIEQQHRRLTEPVYCVIETDKGKNANPIGCEPFAEVDEGRPIFQSIGIITKEPTVGLVPDSVASLRIAYRATAPLTVPVSNNAFLFTSPPPRAHVKTKLSQLAREFARKHLSFAQQSSLTQRWNRAVAEAEPTRIEWLDSSGGLMRTIHPPTATSNSSTSVGNLRAPIGG
jgi:hypothetical protein